MPLMAALDERGTHDVARVPSMAARPFDLPSI